jgi:hypothetical protein
MLLEIDGGCYVVYPYEKFEGPVTANRKLAQENAHYMYDFEGSWAESDGFNWSMVRVEFYPSRKDGENSGRADTMTEL